MSRTACVNLFSFSLQLLLQAHRDWMDFPVAVVSNETATGRILDVNHHARQFGVQKHNSYVTALSLCPLLKAKAVGSEELETHSTQLVTLFQTFSPTVDRSPEAGIFWLDGSGIERLYQTEVSWVNAIHEAVLRTGFFAGICVGCSKFGTYAVAKSQRGRRILRSEAEEQQAVFKTPLAEMDISPKDLELLQRLGIGTLGDLLALPADSLKTRFSKELTALHQLAAASRFNPLVPQKEIAPIQQNCQLDGMRADAIGLLFIMKTMLESLLADLACEKNILHQLKVTFTLDHAPAVKFDILPAMPTLNVALWVELLRLKLEGTALEAGVSEILLDAVAKPATMGQLALFRNQHRRDVDAANRALARIRAKFGEDSVCRPQLEEGHLPAAQFQFVPTSEFRTPAPSEKRHTLIRRIYEKPLLLNSRPVKGPAGIHFGGLGGMAVKEMTGPYIVEGGWWLSDRCREYYFAHTETELLWVYFDRHRKQWFLQGKVE